MERTKVQASPSEGATLPVDGPNIQLVSQANQLLSGQIERRLREHGISLDQWRVLSYLFDHTASPMAELAAATNITGPTLTRVVDQLIESTLCYRNVDSADRRRVLAFLSKRGRSLVRELLPLIREAEAEMTSHLSPKESRELIRLLTQLVAGNSQNR
ncbi:MarR family winged helix-turn-helix transcriptional regulator [Cryobacterium sp. Y11]|uniref:MarR family winged helix-turn-helix transcriptional regulator n=1 Tax=Cryobacterium sp. Y11 TaxID=2045016 RepID=UPI001304A6A3|nr:MarR family transcriptional regulator [Cryobacterium sp. Y11]